MPKTFPVTPRSSGDFNGPSLWIAFGLEHLAHPRAVGARVVDRPDARVFGHVVSALAAAGDEGPGRVLVEVGSGALEAYLCRVVAMDRCEARCTVRDARGHTAETDVALELVNAALVDHGDERARTATYTARLDFAHPAFPAPAPPPPAPVAPPPPPPIAVPAPQPASEPYDCSAGYSNWLAGWSEDKKGWCCTNKQMGCPETPSEPYDCAAGYSNWEAGWSKDKKTWCCDNKQIGCVPVSEPYDCEAGYSNWQAGWSEDKKGWCCTNKKMGCATPEPL